jgi:hypothetical protein
MPDDPFPKPRQRGNSRGHLIAKLRAAGFDAWADAVEAGEVSAFAAAVEAGLRRRPPTLSCQESNRVKRARFAIDRIGRA